MGIGHTKNDNNLLVNPMWKEDDIKRLTVVVSAQMRRNKKKCTNEWVDEARRDCRLMHVKVEKLFVRCSCDNHTHETAKEVSCHRCRHSRYVRFVFGSMNKLHLFHFSTLVLRIDSFTIRDSHRWAAPLHLLSFSFVSAFENVQTANRIESVFVA